MLLDPLRGLLSQLAPSLHPALSAPEWGLRRRLLLGKEASFAAVVTTLEASLLSVRPDAVMSQRR